MEGTQKLIDFEIKILNHNSSLTSKHLYLTQSQYPVMIQINWEKSSRMNFWARNTTCFTISQLT